MNSKFSTSKASKSSPKMHGFQKFSLHGFLKSFRMCRWNIPRQQNTTRKAEATAKTERRRENPKITGKLKGLVCS